MNFRVASFNLLNLGRLGVLYYEQPAFTPEQYEQRISWTANMLELAQPDKS